MDSACQDCDYVWPAFAHGLDHFDQTINGVTIITCSRWVAQEAVANKQLREDCENCGPNSSGIR